MIKKKHIILIPVYNDGKSLNKLLEKIDLHLQDILDFETEILILNDNSSEKIAIDKKKFQNLEKINILNVKKNLGSQKIIALGLKFIKDNEQNFFITVIDSDGEDNPFEIKNMLETAIKNIDYVITSNRKSRKESIIIKILYKIHLILTFVFSFKWISFGNFTTFNSQNIDKILSNGNSWLAHSSAVIKNCKIKRLYAKREKRYFDKSKLSLINLIEHSLRINAVFSERVKITSLFYIIILYLNFSITFLSLFIIMNLIIFNILIIFIKYRHSLNEFKHSSNLIKSHESV